MAESSEVIAEKIKEIRMQISHGYVCYRGHYLLPENRQYLCAPEKLQMTDLLHKEHEEHRPAKLRMR